MAAATLDFTACTSSSASLTLEERRSDAAKPAAAYATVALYQTQFGSIRDSQLAETMQLHTPAADSARQALSALTVMAATLLNAAEIVQFKALQVAHELANSEAVATMLPTVAIQFDAALKVLSEQQDYAPGPALSFASATTQVTQLAASMVRDVLAVVPAPGAPLAPVAATHAARVAALVLPVAGLAQCLQLQFKQLQILIREIQVRESRGAPVAAEFVLLAREALRTNPLADMLASTLIDVARETVTKRRVAADALVKKRPSTGGSGNATKRGKLSGGRGHGGKGGGKGAAAAASTPT
jgi:uncharacterized membrane protein YgcG